MDKLEPVPFPEESMKTLKEYEARRQRVLNTFFVGKIKCERCDQLTEQNKSKSWCEEHVPVAPKSRWG